MRFFLVETSKTFLKSPLLPSNLKRASKKLFFAEKFIQNVILAYFFFHKFACGAENLAQKTIFENPTLLSKKHRKGRFAPGYQSRH